MAFNFSNPIESRYNILSALKFFNIILNKNAFACGPTNIKDKQSIYLLNIVNRNHRRYLPLVNKRLNFVTW